ncbi:YqcC family protein [Vibrio sp. PP-XX7]
MSSSVTALLDQLENQLRQDDLWQDESPDLAALSSRQPFAIDTLLPHEWLQWIFLPQMRQRIEQGAPLPQGFQMTPYFEEVWKTEADRLSLITILTHLEAECR